MEFGYQVETTPSPDGKIVQELFSVTNDLRERIMMRVMDTQEQQIKEALIQLGWTPPKPEAERH